MRQKQTCASSLTKARGAIGVYTNDHEAKRCITCESVPWPVAWVLVRFNLKHRHVHKPPSAESAKEQCVDLERKVLWRWHRDTKGFLDGDAPWRISNMPVAEYPKLPSPGLRLWLSNLRQAVMGALNVSRKCTHKVLV